jgi:hypothetical protein
VFPGRDHLHTAVYRFDRQVRADGGCDAALALDRCCAGIAAVALDPDDDVDGFMRDLVGADIPVAAAFAHERLIVSVLDRETAADRERHALVLAFVDGDVLGVWRDRIEPRLAGVRTRFASPFLRTIPGTDAYVDEL